MSEHGVRRAAVLGSPIAHSLSPVLHRAAYEVLGLDWTYEAIQCESSALAAWLDSRGPEWAGASLTMPLKETALDLVDDLDELARLTRSINTVVFSEAGRIGRNTDVAGIVHALNLGSGAESGAVIGAGATARSAAAALARLGVPRISVTGRREDAVNGVRAVAQALGAETSGLPWESAHRALKADVVISTVPAGVADLLAADVAQAPGVLLDVVYHPWPTALAGAWAGAGGRAVSGLQMLMGQAVDQVELMTGIALDADLRAAVLGAMAEATTRD